jgi:hypothetical protein
MLRITLAVCALLVSACNGAGGPPGSGAPAGDAPTPGQAAGSPDADAEPDKIEGCVPACGPIGIIEPGRLSPGEYETGWFFEGEMRLTVDAGWTSPEDSTGEFSVASHQDRILFWVDTYPVEDGRRVSAPMTAAGLLRGLRSSTQLDVSGSTEGSIGALPATLVDIRVAADAVNDERGNPWCRVKTCALFLGFPQWDGVFGIAGTEVQRFYLSDVTYGGVEHLFVAVISPDGSTDMGTFAPRAERVIATVRVPATPA